MIFKDSKEIIHFTFCRWPC